MNSGEYEVLRSLGLVEGDERFELTGKQYVSAFAALVERDALVVEIETWTTEMRFGLAVIGDVEIGIVVRSYDAEKANEER